MSKTKKVTSKKVSNKGPKGAKVKKEVTSHHTTPQPLTPQPLTPQPLTHSDLIRGIAVSTFTLHLEEKDKSSFNKDKPIHALIPVTYNGDKRFTVLLECTINWVDKNITVVSHSRLPNGKARGEWLDKCGKQFSSVFRSQ